MVSGRSYAVVPVVEGRPLDALVMLTKVVRQVSRAAHSRVRAFDTDVARSRPGNTALDLDGKELELELQITDHLLSSRPANQSSDPTGSRFTPSFIPQARNVKWPLSPGNKLQSTLTGSPDRTEGSGKRCAR